MNNEETMENEIRETSEEVREQEISEEISQQETTDEIDEKETAEVIDEQKNSDEINQKKTTDEISNQETTDEIHESETVDENCQQDTTNISDVEEFEKIPQYHERYYLKYGDGKRTTPLDLEETRNFLQQMGYDGGELKKARHGKNQAELLRGKNSSGKNHMYCSYCRTEISGVEYARLPDGRLRCNNCSNTVVKSKSEVESLCKRVIANMDSFFGATINVPVSIEVVEERKLKKKSGISIGTKDAQSILVLGVAINKNKKYSIILENGAPRISLIATFAHELTHIWQYTHWDNNRKLKKCPKNQHLLIYEGMAKWVEIQYLYLVGETNAATREEEYTRKRQDEYGIGFKLYDDRYPLTREAMICEETPFTTERYPLD